MICRSCRIDLLSRATRASQQQLARQSPRCSILQTRRNYSTPASSDEAAETKPAPSKGSGPKIASICPAGTVLKGLNYEKNKDDIYAMEDHEYPDWLWQLPELVGKKDGAGTAGGVDLSAMNKKQRKRYEKKMAERTAKLPPVVPLHEQSIDVVSAPADTAGKGESASLDLAQKTVQSQRAITKSAREARRKKIKENNFLSAM